MSVAVATDPTIQYGTTVGGGSSSATTSFTDSKITWDASNGLLAPKYNGTAITDLSFAFVSGDSVPTASASGSTLTINMGGTVSDSRQPYLKFVSSTGLKVNSLNFYMTDKDKNSSREKQKTMELDLSGVASGYALEGDLNILVSETFSQNGGDKFIGKFGGQGIKGSVSLVRNASENENEAGMADSDFTFSGNAGIDEDLIIHLSHRNQNFVFDQGKVKGKIEVGGVDPSTNAKNAINTNYQVADATWKNMKSDASVSILYGKGDNLSFNSSNLEFYSGNLTIGYKSGTTGNKQITLNPNSFSGGYLTLTGMNKVVLGGDLTLTPQTRYKSSGSAVYQESMSAGFVFSPTTQAGQSNPIISGGNISVTSGNLRFAFDDTSSVTGVNPFTASNSSSTSLSTYYVDGNITITDGAISAFWDDSKGFYGKVATTSNHTYFQSGGLIGKNDIWFATSPSNVTSIQSQGGTSHLVFDQALTITGAKKTVEGKERSVSIYSILSNKNMVLFNDTATITGDIFSYNWGDNTIIFKKNATIDGNIATLHNASNNITSYGNLTVNRIVGHLRNDAGYGDGSSITINFSGNALTVNEGISAEGDHSSTHKTKITFNTANAKLDIKDGGISARNGGTVAGANGYKMSNTFIFSNGGSIVLSGSDKDTNQATYNFDGILATDGHSNVIQFKGDNDATIDVSDNQIIAYDQSGENSITFEGNGTNTIKGQIVSYDGSNNIKASKLYIEGSVITDTGGTSSNNFSGLSSGSDLALTITEGLYANWACSTNSLNLGSNGSLTITAGGINGGSGINSVTAKTVSITASAVSAIGNNGFAITNSGGTNTINANSIVIKGGGINSNAGTNTLSASGGTIELGASGAGLEIISEGGATGVNNISSNVITAHISNLISRGNHNGNNSNTITATSGTITIDNIIAQGNSTTATHAGNFITLTNGTLNIGSISSGSNKTLNDIRFGGTGVVNGNITTSGAGKNNFTLTADNASLTLKGSENTITTLTALDSATNGNTLTLDATNNNSVVATVATLENGDDLKVNFVGIDGTKTTQLTLDTTNATSLKSVSVASGLNNTLALTGTATMTIAEAVSIGETSGTALKGVIFDLTSGADLAFAKGLTTNTKGVTTFKLGAENVITVSSGDFTNNGIHNFDLNSTTGTTTFKYGASGLAFSSGENNINFNVEGIRLNWQQSDGTPVANITTSGGTTNLNFINTGTINSSGLSTTAGITNINIYNGKTATIGGAIATSGSGKTNVVFKGAEGATTRGVPTYSILNISGASNKITSVTSETNAKIAIGANEGAEIDNITIGNGASLVFDFTGAGASTVTANNKVTVGAGATLGISLGGSDTSTKTIAGDIEFVDGSTLLIDFQDGNKANGKIAKKGENGTPFVISGNSKSIINFWGTNSGSLNASGGNSVTINGGTNTVNFYGDATLGGIAFGTKGGTNTINVVDDDTGITGTVAVADISKSAVTNIINLGKNATLALTSANTTLTSSSTGNELNFIGDNATFQGGFGVSGNGKATINVGMISANPTDTIPPVSGIITGAVSNADLKFNAGESTLTLQGQTNTFTSLTSGASDGILYLDASTSNVSAEIGSSFAIGSGKSLTFALVSGGNTAGATTTGGEASVSVNGAITVGTGGTLGIAIGGNNENGQRSVTASKGITFQGGSTLRVDFLANSEGTASLGTGKDGFIITDGNKSVINFYAGSSATLNGGLTIEGGDNTVNFQGSAQLRDIKLVRGTNTINVLGASAEGSRITATLISENLGGDKFSNTVNLEKFAVLNLKTNDGSGDGSGSIKTLVNVNDENTVIQGNLLDGSSIAFTKKAGGLTLKGATSSGATNTLTTISTVDGASNTLTLDTSNGNNTTTVSGNVNASGLSVNLNTASSTHIATLNLNGGSLKSINVANGDADHNILSLNSGVTSIENAIALSTASTGLSIQFNGGELNAIGGITSATDKLINLSTISNKNSIVSGGVITTNSLTINSNSSLAIRNATATFTTVSGDGTLTLDGANAGANVEVIATSVTSNNITAKFNGNATGGNTLVLSDDTTLADITFGANSTNNTLNVASGKKATISDNIGIDRGNEITFALANDSILTLEGGMTSSGTSTISSAGDASVTLVGGGVDDKNATKAINLTNLDLQGGTTAQLTIKNAKADISNFNAKTLVLDGSTGAVDTTLHIFENNLDVEMKGDASGVATLTLNGGTIKSVSATSGDASKNIINFKSGTTRIAGTIDENAVTDTKGLTLNLNGGNLILASNIDTITNSGGTVNVAINNATLSLEGTENKISSLSGNGVVDLAVADSNGNPLTRSVKARSGFKTLTIADYKDGNNTFNVYVNTKNPSNGKKADQIVMSNTPSGSATFTVMGNIDDILGITYDASGSNNVQVASGMDSVEVSGGDSLIGYDIIQAQVIKDGGNVYLGQAISKGVAQEIKDVASSALTVNYDLFLANFNSLNKRMGELRDNANSQGVWTRVFGGAMSNDFGAGSKTQYVTAQAGYDYSLTLGDARNYMGIAVAYGHSSTKSNTLNIQASQGATIALQDVKSNMVEVGIYNSYVMDSGWYNDTIFKFDYIMSSFTMTDNLSLESETNNFAMVLSDEFGYRYKFAENEKGNWYIDPQVEVAFGYFNQSDFNRAMLATNSTLEASQDNILTLRTRAGLSLGKKFNTAKGFASLYVGAFYEYDYINGGDAEVLSKSGIANPLDKLESNGRAIVNIGSNIELTEGVRMYIDVEKSFGDKQRTDMQFNFGARYSFGEKTPTISYQEAQKRRVAPLKVEDKQENTQEASANTQATSEQEAKN